VSTRVGRNTVEIDVPALRHLVDTVKDKLKPRREPLRRSVWISFNYSVAEADAEHRFAFISFDCCLDALASLVTHFSANVCGVDRWFLAGCELFP
jgi:hypothetical protein